MDFTSNISLIVLIIFFIFYYLFYRFRRSDIRALNGIIAVSSLVMYAVWYPPGVLILLAYALMVRYLGVFLQRRRSRTLLALIIAFLLVILALFKFHFVITFLYMSAGKMTPFTLFLPLGISFYTLTIIGYFVDIYRGDSLPADSLLSATLFVSFWPSLSSGPILRAHTIFPLIHAREAPSKEKVATGFVLIGTGIVKKFLIADNLGSIVNWNLSFGVARLSLHEAWLTMLGFVGQIYGDFSGYSDIAIGLALLIGFSLPANFNYPYTATSTTELWRRWHISLFSWLRDYIYIPLGGNRHGTARKYCNILITFFVSGLWHAMGSVFNYIVWALSNGLIIILEQQFKNIYERLHPRVRHVITLVLFTITASFFRLDVSQAVQIIKKMFGVNSLHFSIEKPTYSLPIILLLVFLCIEHGVKFYRVKSNGEFTINTKPLVILLLCALTLLALLFSGATQQFFYFQF